MRLILAGLFVFGALLALVIALDASGFLEGGGPQAGLVVIAALVGLVALAMWLLNRRRDAADSKQLLRELRRAVADGARLEPDPKLDFRFEFVSKHQDLLDGELVWRRETTGMRGWVRAGVILMGVLWLVAGAGVAVHDLPRGHLAVAPVVWLLLGSGTMGLFVVRPWRTRRAIERETAPAQALKLRFTNRTIECDIEGLGRVRRPWWELVRCVPAPNGIVLEFEDRLHWLPQRAFTSARQRERFEACVATRLAKETIRREARAEPHPILPRAEEATVTGVRFDEVSDLSGPFADVTLRLGETERHLRVLRVRHGLIDAQEIAEQDVRVRLLSLPHRELDGLAVRVSEVEPLGALDLWGEEIVDLDAR